MTKFQQFVRRARTMHHLHKGFAERLFELEPEDVVRLPYYLLNAALAGTVWGRSLRWGCWWKVDQEAFMLDDYIDSERLQKSALLVRRMKGGEASLTEALRYVKEFSEIADVRRLDLEHFAAACVIAWLNAVHGTRIPSSGRLAVRR